MLGTDKTGLTTIEEFEDKSAHVANMWRKHVSQSGLCPELGTEAVVHDFRCIRLSRGTDP